MSPLAMAAWVFFAEVGQWYLGNAEDRFIKDKKGHLVKTPCEHTYDPVWSIFQPAGS